MCGVIGLIYSEIRADLGKIAGELLKTLEYRGYDSTGAAIQGKDTDVTLRKGIGAPSAMIHRLGIVDLEGQILCGQVRWATFGAVDDLNSQPHVVRCKTFLYGAHNGNVTNCDELKNWLVSEGHDVLSDNDGEMVVHTVEHYFNIELSKTAPEARNNTENRRKAMRAGILRACSKLCGSFAAVIVDPVSRLLWAIKQGSSLYFGLGRDETTGQTFGIASSDLSSVLRLTKIVVPLSEGECIEFSPTAHTIFCIRDRVIQTRMGTVTRTAGEIIERTPVRSRLRAKDTALNPPFKTFMDQEISSQEATCRNVVTLFLGGSTALKTLQPYVEKLTADELSSIEPLLDQLRDQHSDDAIRKALHCIVDTPEFQKLLASIPEDLKNQAIDAPREDLAERLVSSEAGFFADLLFMDRDRNDLFAVRLLDVFLESDEVSEFAAAVSQFVELCRGSLAKGGRIYVVCCGTSYHSAKAASLFFNELARTQVLPVLPGEFRGEYSHSLRDGDLFIAVSQSGETKDLIDVMNDVIDTGLDIQRIAVVNNINSTLAQEKSHLTIPLRCGPEIAVPATKSFINQLAVFYCLALELAEKRITDLKLPKKEHETYHKQLTRRRKKLFRLPLLIRETFDSTNADIDQAARLLYLCPSMHLLATRITAVAKEGALKVREVVLNHAEGYEGSEFKHGPNTILGFNTIFGPPQVESLLKEVGQVINGLAQSTLDRGFGSESLKRMIQAVTDGVFSPRSTPFALDPDERSMFNGTLGQTDLVDTLYADYPLIYITGPEDRDVALTVSQINTHKIRGAMTVVIAEDHLALKSTAEKAPANNPSYKSVYITLPRTSQARRG